MRYTVAIICLINISFNVHSMEWGNFNLHSLEWGKYVLSALLQKIRSLKINTYEFSEKSDQICYLAQLPEPICNIIAQDLIFADRESDTEFIERTKNIPLGDIHTPIKYMNGKAELVDRQGYWTTTRCLVIKNKFTKEKKDVLIYKTDGKTLLSNEYIFSVSSDFKKIIYAGLFCYAIIDRDTEKISDEKKHPNMNGIIKAIALNSGANLVAYVNEIYYSSENFIIVSDPTDDTEILREPITLNSIKTGSFNKQGTKVIVHDEKDGYQIFPIVDEAIHQAKSKKELLHYFQQRGVCKSLESSKNILR